MDCFNCVDACTDRHIVFLGRRRESGTDEANFNYLLGSNVDAYTCTDGKRHKIIFLAGCMCLPDGRAYILQSVGGWEMIKKIEGNFRRIDFISWTALIVAVMRLIKALHMR